MRSLDSASDSWKELKRYRSLRELKAAVRLDGHSSPVASAGLRSACWKAFLLFNSIDPSTWTRTLASTRSAYDSLRTHFLRHLENPDELATGIDPLSEDTASSPWATLRKDEELRAEIQQDVDRCMPENLYFRQPETQRMLLDILFVFSKLNPDVSYRQGMHEILAPVLWVVEREAIDLGLSSKAMGEDAVVKTVFDAEHIEHDSFALFSQIMHSAKNFYEQTTHSGRDNPMVVRSRRIVGKLLRQIDSELAKHLEEIDILPQVFLMRWIRLLFGREFPFDDVLLIWDVIFAEDPSIEIVDHICLIRLLQMRWELLDADYNMALTLLLRYSDPDKTNAPQTLVFDALYLRDHMSTEASGYLVLKYTERPIQPSSRPNTPPALQRNITAFSGANAAVATTSFGQRTRPPRNLETLLQSTAKNIYTRGGQAVRNAVDEVHKRAQEIRDSQAPRAPQRGYGALSNRMKALEQRNKQLSELLESAVNELWDYQKLATTHTGHNEEENSPADVEKLSVAIAKAQFVQVYLSDPNLSFPDPEILSGQKSEDTTRQDEHNVGEKDVPQVNAETPRVQLSRDVSAIKQAAPPSEELADPSTFEELDSEQPDPAIEHMKNAAVDIRAHSDASELPDPEGSQTLKKDTADSNSGQPKMLQSSHSPRPPLSQGSFSWMLGSEGLPEPNASFSNMTYSPEQGRRVHLFDDSGDLPLADKQGKRRGGQARKQKATAEVVEEASFDLSSLQRSKRSAI